MQAEKLISKTERAVFDTSLIREGDLIYVEYDNWLRPKAGIVMYVSEEKIIFLYHPDIANVTNRHVLTADDIASGMYRIKWSHDMKSISRYGPGDPEAPDPPKGLEEPEEEGGS